MNVGQIGYVQLTNTMKHTTTTLLLVAATLAWPAVSNATTTDSAGFPQAAALVPIADSDPQVGRREAPLTLVVFLDYQCPYSRRYLATGIPQLRARYGSDLRVVYKDNPLPFHQDALTLATAAHGVYQLGGMKAWEKFVGLVTQHQGAFDRDTIVGLAMVAGVKDRPAFEEGLLVQTWLRQVQESQRVAKKVGANSTPVSYFNGLELRGAFADADLERRFTALDGERAAAKALVTQGFAPIDVYGYRTKQNQYRELDGGRTMSAPSEPLAPLVLNPEESLGMMWLGMKLSMVDPRAWDKVAQSPSQLCVRRWPGDPCTYVLTHEANVVTRIRYRLKARAVTAYGDTLPADASLERTLQVLRCGPNEIGEGGGTAMCARHVRVDTPSTPDGPNIWIDISR
jgi:protein-disulfide isomerase